MKHFVKSLKCAKHLSDFRDWRHYKLASTHTHKNQTLTNVLPCLSAYSLSVSQPALHSHLHCLQYFSHSWKPPERDVQGKKGRVQEEEGEKWEEERSCDKMFSHYPSFIIPSSRIPPSSSSSSMLSFLKLHLISLFTSPRSFPSSGFIHVLSFSSPLFLFFFLFLGRRGGRVACYHGNSKLAASYLFAGLQRQREMEWNRDRGVSLCLSFLTIFFLLSTNHIKKTNAELIH